MKTPLLEKLNRFLFEGDHHKQLCLSELNGGLFLSFSYLGEIEITSQSESLILKDGGYNSGSILGFTKLWESYKSLPSLAKIIESWELLTKG